MADKETDVLQRALNFLAALYSNTQNKPGTLVMVGLKQSWNAVIGTNGQCAMALNFKGHHAIYPDDEPQDFIKIIQHYTGASLIEFAGSMLNLGTIGGRSLCLAALNALSQPMINKERTEALGLCFSTTELHEGITSDDIVTIVGYGDLVRNYQGVCRKLHVTDIRDRKSFETTIIKKESVEKGPKNLYIHSERDNKAVISESDVVLITGSALINNTFDELVGYATRARIIGVYGPSAGLVPEFFTNNKINFIRSVKITDHARFLDGVINDVNMEAAVKNIQQTYCIRK